MDCGECGHDTWHILNGNTILCWDREPFILVNLTNSHCYLTILDSWCNHDLVSYISDLLICAKSLGDVTVPSVFYHLA